MLFRFLRSAVLFLSLIICIGTTAQEITHSADIRHDLSSSPAVMVKGRSQDDLYWLGNAASDDPRVFAMRSDGSSVIPTFSKFSRWYDEPEEGKQPWEGFRLLKATQYQWLDMTSDENYLYILEGGNSSDQGPMIYALGEIDPTASTQAAVIKQLDIEFPGESSSPEPQALFADGQNLYLLVSEQMGVALYRLETEYTDQPNQVVRLAGNIGLDTVHAAQVSPDAGMLAILSPGAVTLISRPAAESGWLENADDAVLIPDQRLDNARTLVWRNDSELLAGTAAGELYLVEVAR